MKNRLIITLLFCITNFIIFSQSVTISINSVSGNVVNVTPSITAGAQDIYLGNFDLNFRVTGNSNALSSFSIIEGATLLSFSSMNVLVELSTFLNGSNFTFNYGSPNPGTQTSFNNTVARIPATQSRSLGNYNLTFSGTPNGTINCNNPQGVFGFSNVSPWGQSFNNTSCSASASIVLPITLSTFSATQHSERSSRLNWSTSSEINSEYFGIERSTDGETWETLDRIAAAGNSFEELAYEFIDDRLPFTRSKDQIFYYRLRLTDLDGTFKYSDIQGVNFSRVQNGIISIYPNPTNDRINFDLSGVDLDAGNIDLSVFDMTGRLLINKNITGNGIELIETQNLPTNIFNVVIRQGENIYQSRVIKIE